MASNTTFAAYPSDDNIADRLIASVQIVEIDDPQEDEQQHLNAILGNTSTVESNAAQFAASYPEIASEADDDYRYAGG